MRRPAVQKKNHVPRSFEARRRNEGLRRSGVGVERSQVKAGCAVACRDAFRGHAGAAMIAHPEQIFQQQVAQYLDWALPEDAFWTHFPAGGGGARRGAFLKSMGLKPGVPDIMIIYQGRTYWLELKAKNRKPTLLQIQRHIELVNAGCYKVAVVRTLEEVEDKLLYWVIPLRVGIHGISQNAKD